MDIPSKKILIVEDEPPLLNLLFDKFTQLGFQVEKAKDGVEGLMLALKSHPDIILLDIIMPNMDGLTMLKNLRVDAWGKDADVLILSNKEDSESISAGMEGKVGQFFIKSDWNINDLVEMVKTRLEVTDNLSKNNPGTPQNQ